MQLPAVAVVEDFQEIVTVAELLDVVPVGLAEDLLVDQVKNDVAEIFSGFDPPVIQDRHGHGAEFPDEEFLDAAEQLFAADVTGAAVFALGEGQGLHDEDISAFPVAGILFMDSFDYDLEMMPHNGNYINTARNRKSTVNVKIFNLEKILLLISPAALR